MYCSACGSPLPHAAPVTCPACGLTHWRNAKPCGSALVAHEGRLLLVRRAAEPYLDYWDIPGGFCEADEHPLATAEREVFEETGLRIRTTGYLGTWLDHYGGETYLGRPVVTMNHYYHAVPLGEMTVSLAPGEIAEVAWFAPDALPATIAFGDHASIVLRAWREAFLAGQTTSPLPDRPNQVG